MRGEGGGKMQPASYWDEGEESSSSSSAQNFGLKLDFLSEDSSSSVSKELVCKGCSRTTVVPGSQFFPDEGRINNSRISNRFNNNNIKDGKMSRFSTLDDGRHLQKHPPPTMSTPPPFPAMPPTYSPPAPNANFHQPHYSQGRKNKLQAITVGIGVLGIALGTAGLIAYGILQVPKLRRKLVPYPGESLFGLDESNHASQVTYGFELAAIIVGASLGILVNILLVYGASRKRAAFIVPWLVYQVLFVALLFAVSFLVLFLVESDSLKASIAVPLIIAGLIGIMLFVIVHSYHSALRSSYKHLRSFQSYYHPWPYPMPPPRYISGIDINNIDNNKSSTWIIPPPNATFQGCHNNHTLPRRHYSSAGSSDASFSVMRS